MDKKEEYLKELLNNPSGAQILSDKLSQLLDDSEFYKYGLLVPIIEKLIDSGYEDTVISQFPHILKRALKDEILDIADLLSDVQEGQETLTKNATQVIAKLDGEDIVDFIELLSDEKKKEIFERNEYSYNLYRQGLIRESTLGGIIKGDVSIFVEEIIKEVSEGKELKKIGDEGTYSDAIETNGYVIKLGETRDRFEIPYHPNILQPLLREKISDKEGKDILIVEVQDKVDTKNVTEEQRQELINKLKKSKIKCKDILYGNIGILQKPNRRRLFDGVGGVTDHDNIKEETLKPGEPVVYDTDMIEYNDFER